MQRWESVVPVAKWHGGDRTGRVEVVLLTPVRKRTERKGNTDLGPILLPTNSHPRPVIPLQGIPVSSPISLCLHFVTPQPLAHMRQDLTKPRSLSSPLTKTRNRNQHPSAVTGSIDARGRKAKCSK